MGIPLKIIVNITAIVLPLLVVLLVTIVLGDIEHFWVHELGLQVRGLLGRHKRLLHRVVFRGLLFAIQLLREGAVVFQVRHFSWVHGTSLDRLLAVVLKDFPHFFDFIEVIYLWLVTERVFFAIFDFQSTHNNTLSFNLFDLTSLVI